MTNKENENIDFMVTRLPYTTTRSIQKHPNYVILACDGFIFNLGPEVTSLIFYVDTFTPKAVGTEGKPESINRLLRIEIRLPTSETLEATRALLLGYKALTKQINKEGITGRILGPSKVLYPKEEE